MLRSQSSLGHSRSFEMTLLSTACVGQVPISIPLKLYMHLVPFLIYSASNMQWRDLETGVRDRSRSLKMAPFDRSYTSLYDFLLVGHCKYSSVLYHFRVIRRWIIVTLKSEGHWRSPKLDHSKAWFGFLFAFHSNYGSIVHHFRDKARYWSKIVIFYIPFAFDAPVRGVPIGILPSRLVWKN